MTVSVLQSIENDSHTAHGPVKVGAPHNSGQIALLWSGVARELAAHTVPLPRPLVPRPVQFGTRVRHILLHLFKKTFPLTIQP